MFSEAAVNAEALKSSAFKEAIARGDFKEIHSLLVYKDGVLAFEEYFEGNDDSIDFTGGVVRQSSQASVQWHASRIHYVASVTKTVTALIAGVALDALKIPVETPIRELLPSRYQRFVAGEGVSLTIHHLLTMTAGYCWDEWTDQDLIKLWQSDDFAEFLLSRPNAKLGEGWVYNSAVPNLLLTIVQNQLGEPLDRWVKKHFFDKLGVQNYVWHRQPSGVPEGAARLHLRPQDMLTIGVLILNGGLWQGEQIVPEAWLKAMTKKQVTSDSGDYGYYTWLRSLDGIPYISAEGDGGQYINIFPEQNMVVVMTQGNYLEWPLYRDQAEAIMRRYIFPAIGIRAVKR